MQICSMYRRKLNNKKEYAYVHEIIRTVQTHAN